MHSKIHQRKFRARHKDGKIAYGRLYEKLIRMKRAWVSSNTVFTFITWSWVSVCWNASSRDLSFLNIKDFNMAFSIFHKCLNWVKNLSFENFLNFEKSFIDLFLWGHFVFSLKPFFICPWQKSDNWFKSWFSKCAYFSFGQFIDEILKFLYPNKFIFFWRANKSNSFVFSFQK